VLLVATGEQWRQEAVDVARGIARCMPRTRVTVFADRMFSAPGIERVQVIIPDRNPLLTKTIWLSQTPYDLTLFLDTDITICDDVTDLFALLDRFDLAVPHAPYRLAHMGLAKPLPDFLSDGVPESFPGMNTGMILYRRSRRVKRFFADWTRYHLQLNEHQPGAPQQPAFRTALYRSRLRFAIIPEEYHCRFIYPFKVCGRVKVLHGRHPDMGLVAERINRSPFPRVGEGSLIEAERLLGKGDGRPYGGIVSLVE
jgi:hypothetical protein